ncbi:dTDP-glucose 4,6-dehydratase [Paenibacillus sp. GCM10023252]|uniref:dTDP-glucose 4,6-dehydratase n=1 Tax=Paenibacillus sp. GCM10023252 TaxID=3252649 RepID=UPI00361D4D2A
MAGQKLLVTGGMGFIGSNFILHMLENDSNCSITNVDALTYAGNPHNLEGIANHPRYRFVKLDLCDHKKLEAEMASGYDAVIHFAAESHVDRSISDPGIFVRTNVLGTHHLLHAAIKYQVGRFVHVSTDEVYGTLGPDGLFTEQSPLAPNSPYSASKAGSDLLARAAYHTYGLPVMVTRCSNNYGPLQYPEKLIPTLITRALENKPVPIYGDGLNIRDWLHVKDHCRAVQLVLERGTPGEVYNIGGSNEHTNLDVARSVLRILGKQESLLTYVNDRLGHDRRYAIDASRITQELGWKPEQEWESGLRDTVEWYSHHRLWWQPLLRAGERKRRGNGVKRDDGTS